jgi:hypothetical protein
VEASPCDARQRHDTDVRAHPVGLAIVDRAHLQADGFERTERALDVPARELGIEDLNGRAALVNQPVPLSEAEQT